MCILGLGILIGIVLCFNKKAQFWYCYYISINNYNISKLNLKIVFYWMVLDWYVYSSSKSESVFNNNAARQRKLNIVQNNMILIPGDETFWGGGSKA